eukprot:Pgem_evm1s3737
MLNVLQNKNKHNSSFNKFYCTDQGYTHDSPKCDNVWMDYCKNKNWNGHCAVNFAKKPSKISKVSPEIKKYCIANKFSPVFCKEFITLNKPTGELWLNDFCKSNANKEHEMCSCFTKQKEFTDQISLYQSYCKSDQRCINKFGNFVPECNYKKCRNHYTHKIKIGSTVCPTSIIQVCNIDAKKVTTVFGNASVKCDQTAIINNSNNVVSTSASQSQTVGANGTSMSTRGTDTNSNSGDSGDSDDSGINWLLIGGIIAVVITGIALFMMFGRKSKRRRRRRRPVDFDDNGESYDNNGESYDNNGESYDNNGESYDNNSESYDNNGESFDNNGESYDNN